jgi:hypothetical protein
MLGRCNECGHPLRARLEDGCVRGACSERFGPKQPSPTEADLITQVRRLEAWNGRLVEEVDRLKREREANRAEW